MKEKLVNDIEYKETEIGLIPEDWEVVSLGNICRFIGGTQPPKREFKTIPTPGYIRLLQIRDFESDKYITYVKYTSKLRIVKEDDVLIARYGASVGKILRGKSGAINVAIVKTIPNEQLIIKDFLFYRLQYSDFQQFIKSLGGRSAQAGFNRGELSLFLFPLPPLEEQKKIAYVLSTIQEAKEKTERIIEATKALKKSLMKHLFTYGPVPLDEVDKVKLKETEIGLIPEDWEVVKLGKVISKPQYGYTANAQFDPVGPKFLRITDIQNGKVNWNTVPFCNINESDIERYKLNPGDIVIARIGATTGKAFFVSQDSPESVFASYLIRIKPIDKYLNSLYLYMYTQSDIYWEQIDASKGGRLKNGINIPVLNSLFLPLPPLDEQEKIANILSTIDKKIEAEENKKKALEELFNSMLHNLMTGKIRVKDLEVS